MKKIIPLFLIVMIFVFGALIFKNFITSHVIVLKDDTRIIVDETWVLDDKVFYKSKGRTNYIDIDRVLDIKQGGLRQGSEIALFIKHQLDSGKETAGRLLARVDLEKLNTKFLATRWGPVLLGIILCIGLSLFLIRKIKSREETKESKPKKTSETDTPQEEVEYSGREIIVEHFLNIFKAQKGADENAPAMLRLIGSRSPDGNYIYELRVKLNDEWTSRRMTLGPIGEDSGSRSKCYYVIYDEHLVVKVPPFPIKKFKNYRRNLQKEAEIADILAPKECLVPRISVVLKKVHPFYEDTALPADKLEDKYVEWIEDNTEYRQYLKIENSYAYFMDLSRYFFLGSIIDKIHDPLRNISKEISKHPDIVWDNLEFEARYGQTCGAICDELRPVYTSFKNRVKDFFQQNLLASTVQEFQIKEWFLLYLSKGKLSSGDLRMKAGTASGLNGIANKLFKEKQRTIAAYRRMIQAYVVNKNLTQNKAQISGMITNMLDLLAWLHNKKVAIRDLKPDNLLVAGDPMKFPQFLESASLYSIGLIDIETAVSFETADNRKINQPPLGGTPSYATPTHTFPNKIIERLYDDLPMILHLQDWYATIGMIFNLVTGGRLFNATAKTLIKIKDVIKKGAKEKGKTSDILGNASRMFWTRAVEEFENNTHEKEKKLKYISLIFTTDTREMFFSVIQKAGEYIQKSIKSLIVTQTIFKSDKLKKSLFSASYIKVNRFKLKFEADIPDSKMSVQERKQALIVLDELEILKKQAAQFSSTLKLLENSVPIISSYDLLKVMFFIVLIRMHQQKWGIITKELF